MAKKEEAAQTETIQPTGAEMTRAARTGFRPDGTPYPGVDPVTGERKAVTLRGLQEELGRDEGVRVYNAIAAAGFGGVPSDKAALNILSLKDKYTRANLTPEKDTLRRQRRERVYAILKGAGIAPPSDDADASA